MRIKTIERVGSINSNKHIYISSITRDEFISTYKCKPESPLGEWLLSGDVIVEDYSHEDSGIFYIDEIYMEADYDASPVNVYIPSKPRRKRRD
jgi:hypothetical protein